MASEIKQKKDHKINKSHKSGFTLIEALIFLFIFSVITMTFYQTYTLGLRYIFESKNRLGAIAVANERMEIIRNLSYSTIGTDDGGEISGDIPHEEDVTRNAGLYHVKTDVGYEDDPMDGLGNNDENGVKNDYKRVSITVSWSGGQGKVELTSRFVPYGVETEDSDVGTLTVNIHKSDGSGVEGSSVTVTDTVTGLEIGQYNTDASGNVTLMGDNVHDGSYRYRINVEKSGHETLTTVPPPPPPPTTYNPAAGLAHASVTSGIGVANIEQNKVANLEVLTVDYLGTSQVADIDFHIVGGKIIGKDVLAPYDDVYNLDEDGQTNASGSKTYSDKSPGVYGVSLDPSETDYELIDTDPISSFSLAPEADLELKVKLAKKDFASLLLRVETSEASSQPILGAHVTLSKASPSYGGEADTTSTGTAFFPLDTTALDVGTYDLKVEADGFQTSNTTITIEENKLKTETIKLTAS